MPPVISVPDSVALKNYLRGVCGDPKVAGFGVIANGYNNANSCSARVSDPHGKVYRFLCYGITVITPFLSSGLTHKLIAFL
jgi:hypothetical protein